MWGRLSDGLQLFQDKLDSVIDKTFKEVPDDNGQPQEGNHNDMSTGNDVTKTTDTTVDTVTESEYDRLRLALEEAELQNQLINKEFRQLLKDKENEIQEARSKAEQEITSFKKQFSSKVAAFREKLSAKEKEKEEMKEQLSAAQEQATIVNQLQDELQKLKEVVKAKDEALSVANSSQDESDGVNVVKLVEESEVLRQEIERLRTELEKKGLENKVLMKDKDIVLERLAVITSEFDTFKQQSIEEKDDLLNSHEKSNADLLRKEQELNARSSELSRKEAECMTMEDKIQETKSQMEKVESDNSHLQSQLHELSANVAELVQTKESLEKVAEEQKTANVDLAKQIEQERKHFKEELRKAEESRESGKQEIDSLVNELAGMKQTLTVQLSKAQAELRVCKQEWDEAKETLMQEKSHLESTIHDFQEKHQMTVSELQQQLDEEQTEKRRQLSELQRQLMDVTNRLQVAESSKDTEKLEEETQREMTEYDMKAQLERVSIQLQEARSEKEALAEHYREMVDSLNNEMASLKEKNEELAMQLKEKEADMKQSLSEQAEKFEARLNKVKIQAKAKFTAMQRKNRQKQEEQCSPDTSLHSIDGDNADWQSKLQSRIKQLDEMEAHVEKEKFQEQGASPAVALEAVDTAALPGQKWKDQEYELAEVRDALQKKDDEYTVLQRTHEKLNESHNDLMDSHTQLLKQHAEAIAKQKQLESELEHLSTQVAVLPEVERRASGAQEEARCLGDELKSMRQELLSKEDTVQDLGKKLHAAEIDLNQLHDELTLLKQEQRNTIIEKEQMQLEVEKLQELDGNLARETEEKASLVERVKQLEKEMSTVAEEEQKKTATLETEIQEVRVRLEETQLAVASKENELAFLQQENDQLKNNTLRIEASFSDETRKWQTQIFDLTKDKEALVEEVAQKNAQLTDDANSFKQGLEAMEVVRLELVKKIDQLQFAQQESEAREMNLNEQKEQLQQKLNEAFEMVNSKEMEKQSQVQTLKEEMIRREKELTCTIEELEKERDLTAGKITHLSGVNASLQEDHSCLQTELQVKEEGIASLQSQISELDSELQMARQTVELRDVNVADLKQQLESQICEVTSLTGTLTTMSEEQKQLQEKLKQTTMECKEHEGSVAVLHSQVNEFGLVRETLETQTSELRKSVKIKENEVIQLEEEKNMLSRQLATCMANLEVSQGNEARIARELAAVTDERSRLEHDINASLMMMKRQLSETTSKLEEVKRDYILKQQAVEDLERQLHVEKQENHDLKKELEKSQDAYRNLIDDDEEKSREMQARILLLEGELSGVQSQLNKVAAEREVQELAVNHATETTNLKVQDSLTQERDRLQKENEALVLQLRNIQQQVEDMETNKEGIVHKMGQMQTENAELNRLKGELEESLRVEHQKLLESQDALTQMQRSKTRVATKSATSEVRIDLEGNEANGETNRLLFLDSLRHWVTRSVGIRSRPRIAAAAGYAVFVHLLLLYLLVL
jgi:chromosome segregation ATPase